jgi:hypothetical protein
MKPGLIQLALALLIGSAWIAALQPATASAIDDPDDPADPYCATCVAEAEPASLQFPALPPATCAIRFFINADDGWCEWEHPEPGADCLPYQGCFFWYSVLCQGDCGNVVPMLFSLGGTALPLWTPCGTNQDLGFLGCGTSIKATFLVYDVTSGATAVKTSVLTCWGCDGDATEY